MKISKPQEAKIVCANANIISVCANVISSVEINKFIITLVTDFLRYYLVKFSFPLMTPGAKLLSARKYSDYPKNYTFIMFRNC